MQSAFDILGLGVVTVDDFLFVPSYPPPDVKTRVSRRDRQCGGLTGTALVAAARLGAKCAYAGILGDDEMSRFIRATFEREGVDASRTVRRADAAAPHSVIVVDESRGTRNIFFHAPGAAGADAKEPPEEFIRAAKVLFVDSYGMEGMIRAGTIARDAGRAVVADFEHDEMARFGELVALVNHLIVPVYFAREITGMDDPAEAAKALWLKGSDTVAVTCGTDGACYISRDQPGVVRRQPAFLVKAVDTTGCGDVFHGAYAAMLAAGRPVDQRMRIASAAAAIKTTQPGGQKGIPTLPAVEQFLAEREG